MSGLVLSLFPGIGLLDQAFEEEGFTIVRGPDVLWGGDVRRFHPPAGKFDGIIGGPPCQEFTVGNNVNRARGIDSSMGNLIPEYERCVSEAQPDWFVMENVPRAPVPLVSGYTVRSEPLCNRWLGEEQSRLRRFSFGTRDGRPLRIETVALEAVGFEYAAATGGGHRKHRPAQQMDMESKGIHSRQSEAAFRHFVKIQGLPEDFDLPGFTTFAKCKAVCNGVPLPMGRAVARAVKAALTLERAA